MLDQRRRRWANIETALGEFPVLAGMSGETQSMKHPNTRSTQDHGDRQAVFLINHTAGVYDFCANLFLLPCLGPHVSGLGYRVGPTRE